MRAKRARLSGLPSYLGRRKRAESWKLIEGLQRDMKKEIIFLITIGQLEDHFKELIYPPVVLVTTRYFYLLLVVTRSQY